MALQEHQLTDSTSSGTFSEELLLTFSAYSIVKHTAAVNMSAAERTPAAGEWEQDAL